MKENLMPLFNQIKGKWAEREQIRETVVTNLNKNLKQTRATLEVTAKEVLRQTKDSKWVSDYVRPMIESPKAEEALQKLETRIAPTSPLVAKLREFRQQFLDATQPATNGDTHASRAAADESTGTTESAPKTKSRKKKTTKEA